MTDIVERLREAHQGVPLPQLASTYSIAADEIERLRAEVERLRVMSRELLPRRPSDLKALDDEQENDR